jgi:hypothetical protein
MKLIAKKNFSTPKGFINRGDVFEETDSEKVKHMLSMGQVKTFEGAWQPEARNVKVQEPTITKPDIELKDIHNPFKEKPRGTKRNKKAE